MIYSYNTEIVTQNEWQWQRLQCDLELQTMHLTAVIVTCIIFCTKFCNSPSKPCGGQLLTQYSGQILMSNQPMCSLQKKMESRIKSGNENGIFSGSHCRQFYITTFVLQLLHAGQFLIKPAIRNFLFQYWKLILPDEILSTILKCNIMTGCIRLLYASSYHFSNLFRKNTHQGRCLRCMRGCYCNKSGPCHGSGS